VLVLICFNYLGHFVQQEDCIYSIHLYISWKSMHYPV